jgi:hypothetical protein
MLIFSKKGNQSITFPRHFNITLFKIFQFTKIYKNHLLNEQYPPTPFQLLNLVALWGMVIQLLM